MHQNKPNWQPEYIAGVKQAWQDSQMDGDDHTENQAEIAQFANLEFTAERFE